MSRLLRVSRPLASPSGIPAISLVSSTTTPRKWKSGGGSSQSARTPGGRALAVLSACRTLAWMARAGSSSCSVSATRWIPAAASSSPASRPWSLGFSALRCWLSGPRSLRPSARRSPQKGGCPSQGLCVYKNICYTKFRFYRHCLGNYLGV